MAPTIVKNNIMATGKTEVVVTAEMLQAASTGIAESQLVFTVNGLPSQGGLKLNGTALAVNQTFTQADISAGKLTYLPSGTTATTDGFGFTVTDGVATPVVAPTAPKIIFSPVFSSTTSDLHSAFSNPVFSADGRYILAGGDPSFPSTGAAKGQLGLFLYDLQTTSIERIAVQASNPNANTPFAQNFDISGDGRYVTFQSSAPNLAVADTDKGENPDIFLFDRQTGTNQIISAGTNGAKEARASKLPSISKDGRYIAFESEAKNLVANDNSTVDIFVYDRQNSTTERVSQGFATGDANSPAISANGRYVVFNSNAGLAPNDLGKNAVYVRDRQTGLLEKVSVNSSGVAANNVSGDYLYQGRMDAATISGDGRYVAFKSKATNLVAGDTNDLEDVFVRDRQTGTTQRVSLDKDGNQIINEGGYAGYYDHGFYDLQLSEDGRYLSFNSSVPNLVAGDTLTSSEDAFIRDLQTGTTTQVANYKVSNGSTKGAVAISSDARYVVTKNLDIVPPGYRTDNLYFTDRGGAGSVNSTTTTAAIAITPPTAVVPEVVPPKTVIPAAIVPPTTTEPAPPVPPTAVIPDVVKPEVITPVAVVPEAKPPIAVTPETITPPTTTEPKPSTGVVPEVIPPEVLVPTPVELTPIRNNNPAPNERNPIIDNSGIASNLPIPGITVENNLFKTSATTKGFGISAASQKATNKVNEIGVFAVDDASGKIGSIAPGTPEYLKAALDIAKPIFTSLAGDFLNKVNQEFSIDPNKIYQFFEIKDGSIASAKQQIAGGKNPTNLLFSTPDANGNSAIKVTNNSNNDGYKVSVNADELVLNVVKLAGANVNSPSGSKSQTAPEGRTIDLSDYAGQTLKADVTTTSSASYTNNVGFYAVEDSIGTIKLANGSFVKPGDVNYAIEAVKSALTNSLQAGKTDSKLDQSIAGGKIYAPVVIAQGTLASFTATNPKNSGANNVHAYFNYIGANSDNVDHFRLIGNNTFGVEDMYGGGDRDFNDLVVTMNVKAVA